MLLFEHARHRARSRNADEHVSHEDWDRPRRSTVFDPNARLVQNESENSCEGPAGRLLQRRQPIRDHFRESGNRPQCAEGTGRPHLLNSRKGGLAKKQSQSGNVDQ